MDWDHDRIEEEIEMAVEHYRRSLTEEQRDALGSAKWSLYYGPSGGGCRYGWDEALEIVGAWADDVEDVEIETDWDEDTGESTYDYVDGSRERIIRDILGAELARYV